MKMKKRFEKTSSYHGSNSEDMAVVALGGVILSNVRKVC